MLLLAAALTRHFFNSLNSAAQVFFSKLDFANTQAAYFDADSWHRANKIGYCLNLSFAFFTASILSREQIYPDSNLVRKCNFLHVFWWFGKKHIINRFAEYYTHGKRCTHENKNSWITLGESSFWQWLSPPFILHTCLSYSFPLKNVKTVGH